MRQDQWRRVNPACVRQQWYLLTVAVALVIALLIVCQAPGGGASLWWAPLAAGPFLTAALLAFRVYWAGIYVSRARIRIRTVMRTCTFSWSEVAAIRTVPRRRGDPRDPLRSDAIHLALQDGRLIASTVRVWNPAEGRKVDGPVYDRSDIVRFTAILNDRLQRSREA